MLRLLHYSKRTEEAYVDWMRRFILHHDKRHPAEMGATEVEQFLTYLAVQLNVASSTQNQALSALLFLYRQVLEVELPFVNAVRAKQPERLPAVLSVEEVRRVLQHVPTLTAKLMIGKNKGSQLNSQNDLRPNTVRHSSCVGVAEQVYQSLSDTITDGVHLWVVNDRTTN